MIWRRRYEVIIVGESGSAISQRSVISEHRTEREARDAASQERRRLEVIRAEEAASWVVMVVRGDEVLHQERPFDGRADALPESPLGPFVNPGARPDEPAADPAGAAGAAPATPEHPTGTFPAAGEGAADPTTAPESGAGAPGPADDEDAAGHTSDEESPAGDAVTAASGPAGAGPGVPPEVPAGGRDDEGGSESPQGAADEAEPAREPEPGATGRVERPSPRGPAPATRPGAEEWDIDTFAVESIASGERERPPADPDADERESGGGRREEIPSGRVPDDVIRRFEESIAREQDRARQRGSRPPER